MALEPYIRHRDGYAHLYDGTNDTETISIVEAFEPEPGKHFVHQTKIGTTLRFFMQDAAWHDEWLEVPENTYILADFLTGELFGGLQTKEEWEASNKFGEYAPE